MTIIITIIITAFNEEKAKSQKGKKEIHHIDWAIDVRVYNREKGEKPKSDEWGG